MAQMIVFIPFSSASQRIAARVLVPGFDVNAAEQPECLALMPVTDPL
jgi:hypothetical protein